MTATQTKPTGNPRTFVEGTVTAQDDYIALMGFLTHGSVSIQLSGTFTGTITFEATTNGTTWAALAMCPAGSKDFATDGVTTATAVGLFGAVLNGWSGVRARYSTDGTGTPVISIRYLPSQF